MIRHASFALALLVGSAALAQDPSTDPVQNCFQPLTNGQRFVYSLAPIFDRSALDDVSFTYIVRPGADVAAKVQRPNDGENTGALTASDLQLASPCADGGWSVQALDATQQTAAQMQIDQGLGLNQLQIPGIDTATTPLAVDAKSVQIEGGQLLSRKMRLVPNQ